MASAVPPPGSASTLSDPFALQPSFTPDIPGDYVFQLTATNTFGSSTDTVVVSATNDGSNPGVDFESEILPVFQSKCVGCHDNTPGYPDFTGVGSSFGETAYLESLYRSFSSRVSVLDPASSLLLQKPTFAVSHTGGQFILPGSADYFTFLDWISQGASRATIPNRWTPTYQKTDQSLANPIQTTGGADHDYAGLDLEPYVVLQDAELLFAVLSESSLHNSDFTYANFFGADLSLSELSDVIFSGADLASATFSGSSLSGADLSDAILEDANFDQALLENADFDSANVSGASFLGADFSGATNLDFSYGNATYDDDTNFSGTGFDPVAKGWIYLPEPDAALMLAVGSLALAGLNFRRRSRIRAHNGQPIAVSGPGFDESNSSCPAHTF